ncbi:hypothetical protein [Pseudomonas sp. S5D5]|uniref:hypothetical protein n=1 Tax=Pseudomonas sp. S5D5 TaxID=2083056 RepID=UPI0013003A17|nr:hypothetical protein [Pseudomonas sp. S5D5]
MHLAILIQPTDDQLRQVKACAQRADQFGQGVPALLIGAGVVDIVKAAQVLPLALVGFFVNAGNGLAEQAAKHARLIDGDASLAALLARAVTQGQFFALWQ